MQKNFPEAKKAFLKARELDPKNVGALMSLAGYYQASGKLPEAEAMYKEALGRVSLKPPGLPCDHWFLYADASPGSSDSRFEGSSNQESDGCSAIVDACLCISRHKPPR